MSYPYILTPTTLTVHVDGRSRTVHSDSKHFPEVLEALKKKDFDTVLALIDKASVIASYVHSGISIKDGMVYYNDKVLHNSLCDRIVEMHLGGFDIDPMVNFLENLMQNPSNRAVNELYLFLEHGQLPITPDGHFLAYKKVNNEFKDYHTGTFDNSPGKTVSMPRNEVDDNRDNTCSHGLHFCSLTYLSQYHGSEGKVVILKINPKNVVSIPSDYNNTKGRTCEYVVVSEYTGPETEHAFDSPVVDLEDIVNEDHAQAMLNGDEPWEEYGDPYGNEGDSWGDDSWAEETTEEDIANDNDLTTNEQPTNIGELDDKTVEEIKGEAPILDGGTFKETKKVNIGTQPTKDGSHKKPDHPDLHNDGIPKAVKALIGETRMRGNVTYRITSVAGPIRTPRGHYTGKWALHITDIKTNTDGVFDMESILKDQVVQTFSRPLDGMNERQAEHIPPETVSGVATAAKTLITDLFNLSHQYLKNMNEKKKEEE